MILRKMSGSGTFFAIKISELNDTVKNAMAISQKKMAAALAAVNSYLEMEEASAAEQHAAIPLAETPESVQSLWSQCGRQEMMYMRRLVQMRAFGRCR